METAEITVTLPEREINFLKAYAEKHQLSPDAVVDRSLKLLQATERAGIHPDVLAVTGILSQEVDAKEEYYSYLATKHQ